MKDILPKNLTTVLDSIILHGGKPILVGGSVRDYFFGISCSDYDIEVYNLATLDKLVEILKTFGSVNFVGKSFGILKLHCKEEVYDFSFPRQENKIGLGHKEFLVTIDGNLSFKEATRRRDFTINSIGYDYETNQFLDPFDGIIDIYNRKLKHIDKKSFIEDPLRVYRAAQLCARFELEIDIATKQLCQDIVLKEDFQLLSKERIFYEYEKLLLQSTRPSIGLSLLTQLNIINISSDIFKNIDEMVQYKTLKKKDNLVLMFYFISNILTSISDNKVLKKTINELQKFQVPKIYNNQLKNIHNEAEKIFVKYTIMTTMPQAFIRGKDLINLGYKPSEKFGMILKKIYTKQLEGEICSKKEAEKLLSTLL